MTFDNIIAAIDNKQYAPIYLLHGEESYFIDSISKKIDATVLSDGEKAFNQVVLYGGETDHKTIADYARQFPMMASHRVVIVNEAQQLKSIKELESYAANPSPQTVLVLNYKHKKLDGRLKVVKNIKENGVVFEAKKLYDNQIAPYISNYLRSQKLEITPQAGMVLSEFIGSDLSRIHNELSKLILNLDEGITKIALNDVTEHVGISKEYNVFELQKAITEKNSVKAFRIVDYFAENEKANPLFMVIAALYTYWTKVYIAAFHRKKSDKELQRLLGLPSPYFVKEYRAAATNYSSQKILEGFELLKIADLNTKGVGVVSADSKSILRSLLIKLFYT